jgi:hypothetical protein
LDGLLVDPIEVNARRLLLLLLLLGCNGDGGGGRDPTNGGLRRWDRQTLIPYITKSYLTKIYAGHDKRKRMKGQTHSL